MGNPNFRQSKAAHQKTAPVAQPSSKAVTRLSEPRDLGEYAGRTPKQVLKVGLGQVGNRWDIGKFWEQALYEQPVDLEKIKSHIKALVDTKLSITSAISSSYVFLTSYGVAIGFSNVSSRDTAGQCFRDWTKDLIPGATLENLRSLTPLRTERASFAIYNIDTRDIKAKFFEDLERFEALLAKKKAKENVPRTDENALRARLQGYYDEFSRMNPLEYANEFQVGSLSPVTYKVLSIRQITKKSGVKTDTWKIEVDSKRAVEVITQKEMVIRFFGAEVNGAYRWKDKVGYNGKASGGEPAAAS
ncbi:hypothetical protein EV426DRAFT_180789 [Tirmania nivea]|nr:hypothetical protein EV426DRAFT_180789 [Tirmania nivea]